MGIWGALTLSTQGGIEVPSCYCPWGTTPKPTHAFASCLFIKLTFYYSREWTICLWNQLDLHAQFPPREHGPSSTHLPREGAAMARRAGTRVGHSADAQCTSVWA